MLDLSKIFMYKVTYLYQHGGDSRPESERNSVEFAAKSFAEAEDIFYDWLFQDSNEDNQKTFIGILSICRSNMNKFGEEMNGYNSSG